LVNNQTPSLTVAGKAAFFIAHNLLKCIFNACSTHTFYVLLRMTPKMGQLHSIDSKKKLNWTAETPTSNHTETIKRLKRLTFRTSLKP